MDCASVVSMKLLAWHRQEWPLPGRRPWSNEDWRSEVERILAARIGGSLDRVVLDRLLGRCRFAEGDLEREDGCHGLAQRVRDEGGICPTTASSTWPLRRARMGSSPTGWPPSASPGRRPAGPGWGGEASWIRPGERRHPR